MRKLLIVFASVCLLTSGNAQAPKYSVSKGPVQKETVKAKPLTATPPAVDLSGWSELATTTANDMIAKYGRPDVVTNEKLTWNKKGPWKTITVTREETAHTFPAEHTDVLEQTIYYRVPADIAEELAALEGNVTTDLKAGTVTVRCDKEANNLMVLNLVNDITIGKKTVAQARKSYLNILQEKKNGNTSAYLQKLMFSVDKNGADAEVNNNALSVKETSNN